MEVIQKKLELYSCSSGELPREINNLLEVSVQALANSHSPYSHFAVSSAVLLSNGEVVIGANQENAAYPSGLCAERVALFSAGAQFPKEHIKAMAICIAEPLEKWPFPCGACLQVLSESQWRQEEIINIYMKHPTQDKVLWSKGIDNMLPFAFNKNYLEH